MTRPSVTSGTHQATSWPAYDVLAVAARMGSTPDQAEQAEAERADEQPAPGQDQRREAVVLVGGDDEVGRAADHRAQRPQRHRRWTSSAPDSRSSTSTRPRAASPAPASVSRPGRWPWRSHRKTTTAAGAVNSMRIAGPTCMCCDRGEVAELRAGDRDRRRSSAISPALRRSSRHRPRRATSPNGVTISAASADPDEHHGAGTPAGVEQASGQGAGQAERGRRDDREHEPGRQPRAAPLSAGGRRSSWVNSAHDT